MPDDAVFKGWPPCDVCRRPVDDPRGAVLTLNVRESERLRAELDGVMDGLKEHQEGGLGYTINLSKAPDPARYDVPWVWSHGNCAPPIHHYEIDGDRFDTLGKAMDWTLHLTEKRWFRRHAWIAVIRRFWELPNA